MQNLRSETGTTLIETMVAGAILLVVLAGLLAMTSIATTYTENHGHLEARTTEYAQDKMEQLLMLAFTDAQSDTVVFPVGSTGGTGLAVGGSDDTSAPVNGYIDWLAQDGTLLGGGTAAPDGWFYERAWKIASLSSGIKEISVTTTVRSSFGGTLIPHSAVVALKGEHF
jgi:hypothetical protein